MGWIAAKVVPSDERRQEKKNQLSNSKDQQNQPPPKKKLSFQDRNRSYDKETVQEMKFQDTAEIEAQPQVVLKSIMEQEFQRRFQKWDSF
jgi:hypothetical protein